ncbi:MAG: hypothetical protein QF701_10085 [Nitrospinota bacterium]|nr:hypothetical protein [Nitrospinota bacterium]
MGRENRNHCARVMRGDGGSIKFANPRGKFRYDAALLEGRKLLE